MGRGRVGLAIWPAVVLLASGASTANHRAIDQPLHSSPRFKVSLAVPARFRLHPTCPVITVSPAGVCPLPAIPAQPPTKPAAIVLCTESLCGSGFYPGGVIFLLATRAEGSTFWRTVADSSGNFRSALPAPLCRFAPVRLWAFDTHAHRSNPLALASEGCVAFTP